jgi:hypothetical protein
MALAETRGAIACASCSVVASGDADADAVAEAVAILPPESRMKHAIGAMAEAEYERAAAPYGAIGTRPAEARALALAAECARANDRSDDAVRCAAAALAFYCEVSAERYGAEIEQLLSAASGAQQGAAS